VLLHGDRLVVAAGPTLRQTRWSGGLWVLFVTPTGVSDWIVERSNGVQATGFLLFGSENYANSAGDAGYRNFTSIQPANPQATTFAMGANTLPMVTGGGRFLFRVFETVALTPAGVRAGGPAVYNLNDILKVSENGLLCNDPDAFLLLATGGTSVISVGTCSVVPDARSGNRLGLDFKF